MIEEAVKIHNKNQFEIKLEYKFTETKKDAKYEVETYFFLPNSLGINESTFRKVNFYDSIQNYIRFKTPVYTLQQIYTGEKSPLAKLAKSYTELSQNVSKQTIKEFEFENKMFADIVASSIRDNTNFIKSNLNTKDVGQILPKHNSEIKKIAEKFRKLRPIISVHTIPKDVFSVNLFADEYISLIIEKYSFKIVNYIDRNKKESLLSQKEEILNLIRKETQYRIENDYHSVSSLESENEDFMSRFSLLKKYVSSVLHIDSNSSKDGKWIEQTLFGISAGLAMLFATAIAFFYQSIYGNLTIQLFIVLIISYIFKDRMKELGREFFSTKFLKNYYDLKIKLFASNKTKIGKFHESFEFVSTEDIPKRIIDIHHKYRTKEFYNKFSEEKVLRYRTKTQLMPKAYVKSFKDYKSKAVTNIFRFDVSRLLSKMDNPQKPIFALTEDGYTKTYGQRVYNMNLVIKLKSREETTINHYRFVLNQNGIKRLESVWSEVY